MAQRYQSKRAARKLAKKSQRSFIITLVLIIILLYATLNWILPSLVNGVSLIKKIGSHPTPKPSSSSSQTSNLAPPILNIPYEATNTAQIDISGYGTPHSKVSLYMDDDKKDIVDVDEDGNFKFQNVSLSLGTNNIYSKSVDEQNLESLPSKTFKIIYDNQKPDLNISEPDDNKVIQGGDKKVKIAGNTTSGDQIFINGSQVITDKDGNFSSMQDLNDGDNNFDIKAVDEAGNSNEVSRKVTYNH